ncbi:unnamed protein product [Allacma fusca]|uniref:G-protein coupled receptors family 1 profile domain-containing protein n=1 Tax=Allacma fusca TaxID=39272 RepID=A0A8J2KYI6_9HEXA|nr:unnamed protein product [Allacma fusca]
MRSVTKFFLGNLAFANLCVAVFCVFQNLSTHLMDSWPFGVILCKMYHFTNSMSYTASILILVAISVERYLVLLHPFRYRRILTIQRLRIMILGVWGFSALLCSPKLYYNDIIIIPVVDPGHPVQSDLICTLRNNLYDQETEDMINFVVLFVVPITIMTILYTKVAMHLRACEKIVDSMNYKPRKYSSNPGRPQERKSKKTFDSTTNSNGGRNCTSPSSSRTFSKSSYHSERCLSTTSTSGFSFHNCSCCGSDLPTVVPGNQCSTAGVPRSEGKIGPQIDKWKFRVRFRNKQGGSDAPEMGYFETQCRSYSKSLSKGSSFGEGNVSIENTVSNVPDCVETFHVSLNSGLSRETSSSHTVQSEAPGIINECGELSATEWRGLRVKRNLSQNRNRQAAVRMLIAEV